MENLGLASRYIKNQIWEIFKLVSICVQVTKVRKMFSTASKRSFFPDILQARSGKLVLFRKQGHYINGVALSEEHTLCKFQNSVWSVFRFKIEDIRGRKINLNNKKLHYL